jgi:hypothetical protein
MRMTQYHHDELTECAHASRGRRPADARKPHRQVPHWRVTWSRATLAAAGASGRPSRSWVIIISATCGA